MAKVNGRIARSFDCAVLDLAVSIVRLSKEFEGEPIEQEEEIMPAELVEART